MKEDRPRNRVETGTGALCAEAQADGVPCPDVGRECETCEKALAQMRKEEQANERSPDVEAW